MENSRPQYSKPVIVDLDDPDQFAAGGGCNTGSSPQGGTMSSDWRVCYSRCAVAIALWQRGCLSRISGNSESWMFV